MPRRAAVADATAAYQCLLVERVKDPEAEYADHLELLQKDPQVGGVFFGGGDAPTAWSCCRRTRRWGRGSVFLGGGCADRLELLQKDPQVGGPSAPTQKERPCERRGGWSGGEGRFSGCDLAVGRLIDLIRVAP